MKFFKAILFSIIFITFSYSHSDEASLKEAEVFLNTINLNTVLQENMREMLNLQLKQTPEFEPYKEVILKFFYKHMSYESLKPDLIKMYSEVFTAAELKEITTFYKTPTGSKTLEKMPELMAKGGAVGAKKVQNNMRELQEMIQAESERIQRLLDKELMSNQLSDEEIESYMVGKWYMSPNDKKFEFGNAISIYSKDHTLSHISYSNKNCNTINLEVTGTWEIKNKKLVIVVGKSSPSGIFIEGEKMTDRVMAINSKDKVLVSINDTHKQYRTKSNTCTKQ